jgi:hypothetical protein
VKQTGPALIFLNAEKDGYTGPDIKGLKNNLKTKSKGKAQERAKARQQLFQQLKSRS